MRKGISVQTRHFAHVCIIPDFNCASETMELINEVNVKRDELIALHGNIGDDGIDSVEADSEFCCMILTEVGLVGSSLEAVTTVANALADWAEAHPMLELREI